MFNNQLSLETILRIGLYLNEPDYLCNEPSIKCYINEAITNLLVNIKAGSNDYSLIKDKLISLAESQGIKLNNFNALSDSNAVSLMLFRYLESLFNDEMFNDYLADNFSHRTNRSDLKVHYLIIREFVKKNGRLTKEFNDYIINKIKSVE